MRNLVRNVLAFLGALTLLNSAYRMFRTKPEPEPVRIRARDGAGRPVQGAVVFFDVAGAGGGIERVVADSTGEAAIALTERERQHVLWLICAPGYQARAGWNDSDVGEFPPAWEYAMTRDSVGSPSSVRRSGWRAPMPRECPQHIDSMMWFPSPKQPGVNARRFSNTEPDWVKP